MCDLCLDWIQRRSHCASKVFISPWDDVSKARSGLPILSTLCHPPYRPLHYIGLRVTGRLTTFVLEDMGLKVKCDYWKVGEQLHRVTSHRYYFCDYIFLLGHRHHTRRHKILTMYSLKWVYAYWDSDFVKSSLNIYFVINVAVISWGTW